MWRSMQRRVRISRYDPVHEVEEFDASALTGHSYEYKRNGTITLFAAFEVATGKFIDFHFTPTRASWLNQVEIWFSILESQSLRGASFSYVSQLREHIDAFIAAYNKNAAPLVWTKAKVHQRRIKGRRISELRFRVLGR